MKKNEIEKALEGLKKVPVAKLRDAKLKESIVTTYMQLLREHRKFLEQKQDLQTVFLDNYREEQKEVAKLFEELNREKEAKKRDIIAAKFEKHSACILAADEMAKEIKTAGEEPVSVAPIDEERFTKAFMAMDEFDLGVIEALYPLFAN